MGCGQKLLLSFMVGVLMLFYGITVAAALTPQEIAEKALAATVFLEVYDKDSKSLGVGSGFFVQRDLIATNYHVIEGAAYGTAKLADRDITYTIEDITVPDKANDLALLKIKPNMLSILVGSRSLPLGDSDTVKVMDTVYVAGNPLGFEGTVVPGSISAIRPEGWPPLVQGKLLQMTAPISKGSSGGPVLNDKGEVIGISTLAVSRVMPDLSVPQNLNFAVAVNHLKALMPTSPTPAEPKRAKPKVTPPPVESKPAKPQADPTPAEPKPVKPKVESPPAEPESTKPQDDPPAEPKPVKPQDNPPPVEPKQVKPQVDLPKPEPPKSQSRPDTLDKGIKLYEQAKYSEAIEALNSAIQEVENPIHQAEAYLYLGGAKRGSGASNDTVKEEFRKAIRHNPNQELPIRVGEDHPIFAELLEEVRKELTGELTVISLVPQTQIWIEGNNIDKKMLGTGRVSSRLLGGSYTVEGIYAGGSQRETVTIELDRREILYIPPIVEHTPPSSISVAERIPLRLNLISSEVPQQVTINYKVYGRKGNELVQNNQGLPLWERQSASSTWIYAVGLPSQKRIGLIEYYIEIGYDSRMAFRYPRDQSRHYRIPILDNKQPTISVLYPPDGERFTVGDQTTVRAEVIDNSVVEEVRIYFLAPNDRNQQLFAEGSSDRYATADITLSQVGIVEYYLTATDEAGNRNQSESRHIDIRMKPLEPGGNESDDQPDTPTEGGPSEGTDEKIIEAEDNSRPTVNLLDPPENAQFMVNKKITFRAKVTDDTVVKEVLVHFSSDNIRKLSAEGSSDIYAMDISFSRAGSVEYYLTATDEAGNRSQSESRHITVVNPLPPPPLPPPTYPIYQGMWASVAADGAAISGSEGSYMFRLAYLREGKGQPTLGAQLDFSPNRKNMSAMFQWGPALAKSKIAFTLLGGIAAYEDSSQLTHTTPIFGGGLKFYPRDRIVIDATGSIKSRSEFDTSNFYHYEVGIRFYITPELGLRAGYGKLYLGDEDITTLQIGIGVNF